MKKLLFLVVLATISTSVFATEKVEPKEEETTVEEVIVVEEIVKN